MKFPLKSVSLLGVLVIALIGAGCGDGDAPQFAKVDVAAKLQQLKGSNDDKATALTELATAGPNAASAVDDLIPLLKNEDPVVRQLSAYALGQIGPQAKRALPALKAAMSDQQMSVLTAVQNAIRSIDPVNAPKEAIPNVSGE